MFVCTLVVFIVDCGCVLFCGLFSVSLFGCFVWLLGYCLIRLLGVDLLGLDLLFC